MIVGLDTAVVVRLLTSEPPDLASLALAYLQEREFAGDVVQVSDWVLAETCYALQHHYGVPKKLALEWLRRFANSAGIQVSDSAKEILALPGLESASPGFVDRLIHRAYVRGGAREVVTFETSARKLPGMRVLRRRPSA